MEQSPPDPQPSTVADGGTVVSEGLAAQQPPPALFFGERMEIGPSASARPSDVLADRRRHSLPSADEHMASPEKERGGLSDAGPLLSDPWSGELISHLLSRMSPPLASHPQCVSWQRGLPDIGAKKTIGMGSAAAAAANFERTPDLAERCSGLARLTREMLPLLRGRKRVPAGGAHLGPRSLRYRVPGHRPRQLRQGDAEGKMAASDPGA